MPNPGMRWRHIVINTHSTWLPGDERGFRSRDHRIHSSGDYKNPPPIEEHEGLRNYHESRSSDEVHLDPHLRPIIGKTIIAELRARGLRILAIAITKVHGHLLVELVDDPKAIKKVIGEAKRKSSRAIKKELPGTVWSAGCTYKPVDSRDRLEYLHGYVIYDQGMGAWTWSYRDGSMDGMFGRRRPKK